MTEAIKRFWGDDEHDDEVPEDFVNAIEILFLQKPNTPDAQKLRAFELHLRSGSVAKQWWSALPSTNKDTWEHLLLAFKARWPDKTATVKTVEEKQAALERTKITEEEIGTRVKVLGVEEFAHVVWADKIEKLAAAIPDTNGLLIGSIRKAMPKVLQKVTGSGHTDWVSFCGAIRTATLAQIEEAKEEEKEAQNLREQVRKLQELRNTSTRDITNALQRLTVNTPTPVPRFPTLRTQPPHTQNPHHPPAQTFNQYPARAAYQAPNQMPYRQNRPPAARMEDVIRLALPIHPNTPAGRALYNAQITQWNLDNPGQYVSETRPYPLSPGTTPVGSGECWKCGMLGHTSPSCQSTNPIPTIEGRWRSIAGTIKRTCTPAVTSNINYVGNDNSWATKEDYDQHIIAEFLASQGKEQGSSA